MWYLSLYFNVLEVSNRYRELLEHHLHIVYKVDKLFLHCNHRRTIRLELFNKISRENKYINAIFSFFMLSFVANIFLFSFNALHDQCFWNSGRRETYQMYDYGLKIFTEIYTPGFPQNAQKGISLTSFIFRRLSRSLFDSYDFRLQFW